MKIERFDHIDTIAGSRCTNFTIIFPDNNGYAVNICNVHQFSSAVDFNMQTPRIGWNSWQSQSNTALIRLIAEAFKQAADLADKWAKDTGKPYKEVLQ